MKKAFFVTGPEGSGTHMMARALHLSGCTEVLQGMRTYNENYEHLIPGMPDLVIVHRSLPTASGWPNWSYAEDVFTRHDYETFPIFMIREFHATFRSQKRRGLDVTLENVKDKTTKAFYEMYKHFHNFIWVTYEAFCFHPPFRKWLFVECFGLPETTIQIYEANSQYYG